MPRMNRTGRIALISVLTVLALAGCGSPAATSSAAPAPASALAPVLVSPSAAAPPATTGAGVGGSWVMPDLVGSNLQDAQDAIQRLTNFGISITTSSDASGAGRNQVLDRNWKVCTQNVKAGATITGSTSIDFGAVKLDERC